MKSFAFCECEEQILYHIEKYWWTRYIAAFQQEPAGLPQKPIHDKVREVLRLISLLYGTYIYVDLLRRHRL